MGLWTTDSDCHFINGNVLFSYCIVPMAATGERPILPGLHLSHDCWQVVWEMMKLKRRWPLKFPLYSPFGLTQVPLSAQEWQHLFVSTSTRCFPSFENHPQSYFYLDTCQDDSQFKDGVYGKYLRVLWLAIVNEKYLWKSSNHSIKPDTLKAQLSHGVLCLWLSLCVSFTVLVLFSRQGLSVCP